jgi:hypothetical protein
MRYPGERPRISRGNIGGTDEPGGGSLISTRNGLALVFFERDVHQSFVLRMISGFRDPHFTTGMSNKNDCPILRIENEVICGDVIGQYFVSF